MSKFGGRGGKTSFPVSDAPNTPAEVFEDWSDQQVAYQQVSAWFFDGTTGSDTNTGTSSGSPLATWREWYRRTAGKFRQSTTLTIVANAPTDFFSYGVEPISGNFVMTVVGVRTVQRTGTASAYAAHNPAAGTNEPCRVTDGGVTDWTSDVGRLLVDTASQKYCWVLLNQGAGVARTSRWCTTAPAVTTPPSPGGYSICTLSVVNGRPSLLGENGFLIFRDIESATPQVARTWRQVFFSCRFTGGVFQLLGGQYVGCCHANAANRWIIFGYANVLISGGACFTRMGPHSGARVQFDACTFQGEAIGLGFTDAGNTAGFASITSDTGIFDASAVGGFAMSKGSYATISGVMYGKGNLYGALLEEGSKLIVGASDPTITGTTEILLNGTPNQVPDLVAGAAVPAAAAMTTWAQWAAAPFGGRVITKTTDFSSILRD